MPPNVSPAGISLAWLRRHRVVAAPIVGALKPKHIDDAVVALSTTLSDDEAKLLEGPYTPRLDNQGVSYSAALARIMEAVSGFKKTTPAIREGE